MSVATRFRKLVFSIRPEVTTVARRGFRVTNTSARDRLERIGQTFVHGYHTALEVTDADTLGSLLDEVPGQWQGFAYEGAAMALALLDHVMPTRQRRWEVFLSGPGDAHAYMMYVGTGWAAARIPWVRRRIRRRLTQLDPLLGWLLLDGYGFHEGYFHTQKRVYQQAVPSKLSDRHRQVFDQGLGRSLWFVEATDPGRVETAVNAFSPSRHADLWSGVGLASTYAGGADRAGLESLATAAGRYRSCLAQGAAFAAKVRVRAGNETPHTELACEVLCEMSAAAAAAVTDQCLAGLAPNDSEPAYEQWRRRIQEELAAVSGEASDNATQPKSEECPEGQTCSRPSRPATQPSQDSGLINGPILIGQCHLGEC